MESKSTVIEIERCFGIEDPNKIIGELVAKKIKSIKEKEDEMEKASSCKLPFESENMS
ncbi:MAG: hypothetical protein OSJ61_03600 [Lachnospiraceae bacterium]|nr:hypothetical protein [Lachnospiraceae bacterium]